MAIVGLIEGSSIHVVGPESTSTCKPVAPQWNSSVGPAGIEPATRGLKVRCSAN